MSKKTRGMFFNHGLTMAEIHHNYVDLQWLWTSHSLFFHTSAICSCISVCVCVYCELYYLLEYFMSWRVFLRLPRQPRRESKRATQTAGEKEKEPSSDRQGSLTNKSVCRHATMRMQESPSICLRTLIIRSSACYSVVPKHWFRVMMTEPPWTRAKWLWTAQYSAKRS